MRCWDVVVALEKCSAQLEAVQKPVNQLFGLGFQVLSDHPDPLRVSQASWGGLACTEFFVNPEQRLFGVFFTQVLPNSGEFRQGFVERVYASVE